MLRPTERYSSLDFPTFGKPTIPHLIPIAAHYAIRPGIVPAKIL